MAFPEKCVRGIANPAYVEGNGKTASRNLYQFPSSRKRGDGWIEESVNWMDDDQAVTFTLDQTDDDGERKFKVGIALLPLNQLDTLKRHPGLPDAFGYERATLPGNDYHGNLLLHGSTEKTLKNMIRDFLALVSQIVPRNDSQAG